MKENKTLDSNPRNIVTSLHDGMEYCYTIIKPALEKKQALLQEYANGYFSSAETSRRPLNMVARAINLLMPLLASNNPRGMVRPRVAEFIPASEVLRLTLNHLSEKIELGETLREVVLNSLVYMGIIKKGICPGGPGIEDAFGKFHDAGMLFCDSIHPEDYFFDATARRRYELDFEGNYFYAPVDFIRDSGLYKNYDDLSIDATKVDKNAAERIAKGEKVNKSEFFKPYVRLAEVYIPSEKILVTIPVDGQGKEPLRTTEYTGPVDGPYDVLSYHHFPESIIPIAPLFVNLDLHYMLNIMARKMARQANREKKVLVYQGNASDDAAAIVKAADGASVKVADINAMKEIEFGGTADASYNWVSWLKDNWSEQLGNANLVGGLDSQAKTLGQEQMLMNNASASISDMEGRVHGLLKRIFNTFAFHIFTDPFLDVTVSKRRPGLYDIPVHLTADTRQGDFWSYNFDVEPYSMQRMNPQTRMNKIMQLVTGLIVPTMEAAAQQGAVLNIPELVKVISKDMELTSAEIDQIYKTQPKPTDFGPYTPSKGSPGVGDQLGASQSSKELNLNQYQNRTGGSEPSYPKKVNENA